MAKLYPVIAWIKELYAFIYLLNIVFWLTCEFWNIWQTVILSHLGISLSLEPRFFSNSFMRLPIVSAV